jgi:hypothetical protein
MSALRDSFSAKVAHVRANPLESTLLFFALGTIALAMYMTIVVALTGDRTQDLTFVGTTSELGRSLSASGPGHVGRLDARPIRVGKSSVTVDTIIVVADSLNEPAFAQGGFVHDQIALYNDFVVRQAVLSSLDASGARMRLEAPTLIRTVASEDGTRSLSDRPSPYGMVIRSPYAEGSWREVRTTDWRSSPALLGYDGQVSLPASFPEGVFQARLNGRDCSINRQTPQYFLYCQSAMAADANRFYDFGFQMVPGASAGGFQTAGPYRQRNFWMNGRAETLGQRRVNGGDVFDVSSVGSFLLSTTDWGTLAAEQWINGRRTFANSSLGTLSFFAPAGRSTTTAGAGSAPLVLSFDGSLSADLDRASLRFMNAHDQLLSRLAVVIVDVRSGEVRAIAEPARVASDEPLLSFEPILVGSVVKPIMASAILSQHPALGDLRLNYSGDTVTSVAGLQLTKGFANEANGCTGLIDFNGFLRCSSNQYAAEFMVKSLQEDGLTRTGNSVVIPRAVLEKSAIAKGLAEVFDVDAFATRTAGRLALYWNPDSGGTAGAKSATTDRTLIPYESRPWILFPDSIGTRVDWVARYAFGGWENRWTLLGLAQAYARIATDHNVQATFLHRSPPAAFASSFPLAAPSAIAAFARVRGALRQVGVSGTAAGMSEKLQAAIHQPITILSKTGTLNESAAGGRLKALVIAMGVPSAKTDDAPLSCGLVAVTYFEFAEQRTAAIQGAARAALPRIHRDFAEGPLADVLSRHWRRLSGCEQPLPATTVAGAPSQKARK